MFLTLGGQRFNVLSFSVQTIKRQRQYVKNILIDFLLKSYNKQVDGFK